MNLSGGFDTRTLLCIFLNSGIDLKNLRIFSSNDKKYCHKEDFKIASKIADSFGFKLNKYNLDTKGIDWNIKNTIFSSLYSKLGFHKDFYLVKKFFNKPIFQFHGGGEIRGYPGKPIEAFIKGLSLQRKKFGKEFYISSVKVYNNSISFLKNQKLFRNNYDISAAFYQKGHSANHDGKAALEGFISNIYYIQPLIDPDIKKIKFDMNKNSTHDLIAYVFIRFAHNLIYFPLQGKRTL